MFLQGENEPPILFHTHEHIASSNSNMHVHVMYTIAVCVFALMLLDDVHRHHNAAGFTVLRNYNLATSLDASATYSLLIP